MYRPMAIPPAQDIPPMEWGISRIDGGLCLEDLEFKILDNQSPYMLNMWYKEKVLTKRPGQEYFGEVLSGDPILQSIFYKDNIIFHSGTKLYKKDNAGVETEIFSGLSNKKGSFFIFDDVLYYVNGKLIQYDGTAKEVEPFVPVVIINRTPTGGGDTYQNYNRIGAGFETWFNGDGSAVNYQLPQSGLDAKTVICTIGGVAKTEGTDFTINRTTGVMTFNTAPAIGQNNIRVIAYKTDNDMEKSIKDCKYATTFGGDNNTRVFVGGNGTKEYYWSGLQDPSYWPDNNYNYTISGEDVTGFGKQYDILAIFTPKTVDRVEYILDIDGAYFPAKQINSGIGCDMPWSIQLIDNRLTWGNTYAGIHTLVSTNIRDERNIQMISRNINGTVARPGLMMEDNLKEAVSIDYDGKYWLCVNDKVYLWDYVLSPYIFTGSEDSKRLSWFYFENIKAKTFVFDEDLYYGDSEGRFVRFIENFNDFGEPIPGVWRSAVKDFGVIDYLKDILEIHFTTTANIDAEINITHYSENGEIQAHYAVPKAKTNTFSWAHFDWSNFTWASLRFANSIRNKAKIKNILYYQIEFKNENLNENLSITDLLVKYRRGKKVK